MRVAVFGATGLVGAPVVERLLEQAGVEVLPVIHSSGNAWRLARHGIDLRVGNLLDYSNVEELLRGCTHVINCSRGGDDVMIKGLQNLLAASKKTGVRRFVHLSSVAVYGDPPPPQSVSEDAPTEPKKGSYGATKLAQDRMVQKACAEGLPAVILCPPNISGHDSYFLLGLLDAVRQGTFVYVDNGSAPCNLVDVENLAYSAELALRQGAGDGSRLFVTDDEPVTWRDVVEPLRSLSGRDEELPTIARTDLTRQWERANDEPRRSLGRSLMHLVSSDVREALRRDPLWRRFDMFARGGVARLGGAFEERMRLATEGPIRIAKVTGVASVNLQLSAQQLRGVRHDCARAKSALGYKPLLTFRESMKGFIDWYRRTQGLDGSFADLLTQLR